MYKINGENVSPQFLEEVLGNCPQIYTAAVTGVPDEKHGPVGAAFIQLYEDTPENRQETERYAKSHLAKFQVPKYYIYMKQEDWPRTASGKNTEIPLKGDGRSRCGEEIVEPFRQGLSGGLPKNQEEVFL